MRQMFAYSLAYLVNHVLAQVTRLGYGQKCNFPHDFSEFTDDFLSGQHMFFPWSPGKDDPMYKSRLKNQVVSNFPLSNIQFLPCYNFSQAQQEAFHDAETDAMKLISEKALQKKGFPVIENASLDLLHSLLSEKDFTCMYEDNLREDFSEIFSRLPHFIMGTNKRTGRHEAWLYNGEKGKFRFLLSFDPQGEMTRDKARIFAVRICNFLAHDSFNTKNFAGQIVEQTARNLQEELDKRGIFSCGRISCHEKQHFVSLALSVPTEHLEHLPFLNDEQKIFSYYYNMISSGMILKLYDYRNSSMDRELVSLLDAGLSADISTLMGMLIASRMQMLPLFKTLYETDVRKFEPMHSTFNILVQAKKADDGFDISMGLAPLFPVKSISNREMICFPQSPIPPVHVVGENRMQYAKTIHIAPKNGDMREKIIELVNSFFTQEPMPEISEITELAKKLKLLVPDWPVGSPRPAM